MDSKTENQAVSDTFEKMLEQQIQRKKEEAYKYRDALPVLVMLVTALSDESLSLPNGRVTLKMAAEIARRYLDYKHVGTPPAEDNAEAIEKYYKENNLGQKMTFDKIEEEGVL